MYNDYLWETERIQVLRGDILTPINKTKVIQEETNKRHEISPNQLN